MTLPEYRAVIGARLLSDKLAEVIGSESITQTTEEQVHARHILLRIDEPVPTPAPLAEGATPEPTTAPLAEGAPTPELRDEASALALAEELRQRLVDGEDFATLAEEYSDDTGSAVNGGDLGWFGRGMMVPPFDEAVFSLEPGETSEPVRTDFGYHIIQVFEKDENRPRDEAALNQERRQAYQDWLRVQIAAAAVERPDDLASKLPSDLSEPLQFTESPPAPQ